MRNVLVFQLARFGDIVQSKRLLLTLAAQPETSVHFCVDSSLAGIAKLIYPFACIHELPAHKAAYDSDSIFSSAAQTFSNLRDIDFSEVYLLNFSPLSFACASFFSPEILRGYARVRGQEMKGKFAHIAFNLMQDRRFSPINLVDLWANFHPLPVAPEKVNPIPRPAQTHKIGIIMAGRESRRSLPPAELASCVQAIFQARGGPELVCLGSAQERILVRQLIRHLPSRTCDNITDLTGQTRLTDLPEIISGLDLVLTPDTGAMHLAAHLGIPVHAFFLSSAWCYETGPYGFGHKVWQALQPCSPCRESDPCPHNVRCLASFSHPTCIAHMSGKYGESWPVDLLGCTSILDDLGVTYNAVDGDDPYSLARTELRSGLLEFLDHADYACAAHRMRPDLAEFLFTEKDWVLPDDWQIGI